MKALAHNRAKAHRAALSVAIASFALSTTALADVRREGTWPETDPPVTIDLDGATRAQAIKALAAAAQWSVVSEGLGTEPIDVHVTAAPAGKVLDVLLGAGHYVARRDGNLVTITREAEGEPSAPEAEEPSPPPASPPASQKGPDRVVTGGSLRIEKGETVHDVSVLGGDTEIWGTVTGDLDVLGGSALLHEGAHVKGDAAVVGGSLEVERGARIDGDVEILGGSFERDEGATIGGDVDDVGGQDDDGEHTSEGLLAAALGAMSRAALIFVVGAFLLSLAPTRMDVLMAEVAKRPMRNLALGLASSFVLVVLFAALCITVIGIPIALLLLLAGGLGIAAGAAAGLTVLGAAASRHRTKNVHVHLIVGCGVMLVLTAIPGFGKVVSLTLLLTGLGALVETRAAGLFPKRNRREAAPES